MIMQTTTSIAATLAAPVTTVIAGTRRTHLAGSVLYVAVRHTALRNVRNLAR